MFFEIWGKLRSLRIVLFLIMVVVVLDAILSAVSISMILPLTNAAMGGVEDQSWLIRYIPETIRTDTTLLIYVLVFILALKVLTSVLRVIFSIHITENIRLSWQVELSRIYVLQPFGLLAKEKKGKLINDLIQETDTAASFVFNYINYLAQFFIMGTILIVLLSINWIWIAGIASLGLGAWIVIGRPYFNLASRLGKRGIKLGRALNSAMYESLNGIKDIKISRSEEYQLSKISLVGAQTNRNRKLRKVAHATPTLGKEFVLVLAAIGIALFMPKDLEQVESLIPQIALFIAAAVRLTSNVSTIAALRFKVTAQFPSFKLIVKNINSKLIPKEQLNDGKCVDDLADVLEFKNLHFNYDNEGPILQGLSMQIQKGKTTCIQGPSGSGKTTLVDILSRLYDPKSGSIYNGKVRFSEYSIASWRKLIGYVPQEPVLYYGSLEENIRLGDDTITDAEIRRACELANVNEFVEKLPDGYRSILHEAGSNLSGGQKKRLALARALAHRCQLIVLDETTSAIEELSERQIIENLQSVKDLTLIIITHRKSTLEMADRCYSIRKGQAFLN